MTATDNLGLAARHASVPTNRCSLAGRAHAFEDEDPTMAWQTFLDELDHYIHQHGHANVPQNATGRDIDGKPYPLGRRVNWNRTQYRAGKLHPERISQLEERPGWTWEARTDAWQKKLDQIRDHLTSTGDLTGLPRAQQEWLHRQRNAYNNNDLSHHQINQLQSIPGALTDRRTKTATFVQAARIWLAANPGKDLTELTTKDMVQLDDGTTLPLLKRAIYYRHRRAGREGTRPLTADEIAALQSLRGWTWDGTRATYTDSRRP